MCGRGTQFYVAALLAAAAMSCTTSYERAASSRLRAEPLYAAPAVTRGNRPATDTKLDGSLAAYVAYAMKQSPSLVEAFARWHAAVSAIAVARKLPEPMLGYGLFVRSVETRVGPQRHRFSLQQQLPWPAKLDTAADVASAEARAAEQVFRAQAHELRSRIARAYWRLWLVDQERGLQQKQRDLLRELSAAVRSRVEIGKASLAELSQVDLGVSRLDDELHSLAARKRIARAALIDAIGAPAELETPIAERQPKIGLPARSTTELRRLALVHPRINALRYRASAELDRARNAQASTWPNLILGVDYIETGPAAAANVPDSGKDALVLSVGVALPIWRGSYRAAEQAAVARASAWQASARARRNTAWAELSTALAMLRDSRRRIATYRKTLIPQAETVYAAVTGTFQTGATSLASVLIAERDLIGLRVRLVRALAEHATAWATLEYIVGRQLDMEATR